MCELDPSQVGVDIVATTLWLGHESMQTAHGRTRGRPILQELKPRRKYLQKTKSFRDTQSRQVAADAPRHTLIKCGVDSPLIHSQTRSPQFTPHFIVLGISENK